MQKWDKGMPINAIIQVQPSQGHSFIDSGYGKANKGCPALLLCDNQ